MVLLTILFYSTYVLKRHGQLLGISDRFTCKHTWKTSIHAANFDIGWQ